MRRLLILALLLPCCASTQNPATVGPVAKSPHLMLGRPGSGAAGRTLIARRGYACLHSADSKTPFWVSYYITKYDLESPVPRRDTFCPDPDLAFGFRAELSDYRGSGFDRGHMASNSDMSRDVDTQAESFYLSNLIPQDPTLNRQFWRMLEEKFRDYVNEYGSLYIITGPIYSKPLPEHATLPRSIGADHVAVPTWVFKIAVRMKNGHYDALALEVPNLPIRPRNGSYAWAAQAALTSIDRIETDTGLDFLNALPTEEQQRVESKAAPAFWPVPQEPQRLLVAIGRRSHKPKPEASGRKLEGLAPRKQRLR